MGIPGEQIDGNDIVAVREAADRAVARARAGEGPTLIEAMTYRWHGHNEGEEAFSGAYRPDDEQAQWRDRDPIKADRARLLDDGLATADVLDEMDTEETERVEAALRFAEESPEPDVEEALQGLFATAHDDTGALA